MASWNPQKVLDKYIHDYMVRKNMHGAAAIFAQEVNMDNHPLAVESAQGFLKEWWGLFWETYTSINPPAAENKPISTMEELIELFETMFPNHKFNIPPSIRNMRSANRSAPAPISPESLNQKTLNNIAMQTPAPVLQQALGGMTMSSAPQQFVGSPANNPGFVEKREMPTIYAKMYEQAYLKRIGREDLAAKIERQGVERMSRGHGHDENPRASGGVMREMPTIFAKMYEQEYLKRTGRADLAAKLQQSLGVEHKSQLPSSSQFSPQAQQVSQPEDVLEKIEQRRIMVEVQQQPSVDIQPRLGRNGRRGTNGETSEAPGEEGATLAGSEDAAHKGKGKLI